MSAFSDSDDEMLNGHSLDDDTIDALLAGHPMTQREVGRLSLFVEGVRSQAAGPVPEPSAPLAALLADGLSTEKGDLLVTAASNVTGPAVQAAGLPKWRQKKMATVQFVSALSLSSKVLLGAGVAVASSSGAAAAGVLPASAQHALAVVVNQATPFTISDGDHSPPDESTVPPTTIGPDVGSSDSPVAPTPSSGVDVNDTGTVPSSFGQDVSDEAHADDETPGVDGQVVSETAQAHRAGDPPSGLDQANGTPATGHVPTSVPPTSTATTTSAVPSRPATGVTVPATVPDSAPSGPPTTTVSPSQTRPSRQSPRSSVQP